MAKVQLRDLYKEFSVKSGIEVAVDGVDLTVEDGEFVSLVGPSGCGKSTTLRMIAGLETPTSGSVYIGEEEVTNKPAQKRSLSMVFQDIALYPHMSVQENIEYPLKLDGVPEEERHEKSREAADILQIGDYLDKGPNELSGGQAQRVSLARAIVRDPAAFMLDEPMSDLDAKLKMEMRKELGKIHKEVDATMLYVTHDQEEAMTLSDKIAVMNDGQIEQAGSPEAVYRDPVNTFVAKFIGSPSINMIGAAITETGRNEIGLKLASDDEVSFELNGDSADVDPGMDVAFGFRPKHTKVVRGDTDGISGTIVLNETIGDDVVQYIDTADGEIRAVVPLEETIDEGTDVTIQVQTSGIYVFDSETGEKLARGNQKTRKIAQ